MIRFEIELEDKGDEGVGFQMIMMMRANSESTEREDKVASTLRGKLKAACDKTIKELSTGIVTPSKNVIVPFRARRKV